MWVYMPSYEYLLHLRAPLNGNSSAFGVDTRQLWSWRFHFMASQRPPYRFTLNEIELTWTSKMAQRMDAILPIVSILRYWAIMLRSFGGLGNY